MFSEQEKNSSKWFYLEDGKIYFTRTAERKFFFALTMLMLVAAVLFKLGVF